MRNASIRALRDDPGLARDGRKLVACDRDNKGGWPADLAIAVPDDDKILGGRKRPMLDHELAGRCDSRLGSREVTPASAFRVLRDVYQGLVGEPGAFDRQFEPGGSGGSMHCGHAQSAGLACNSKVAFGKGMLTGDNADLPDARLRYEGEAGDRQA